MPSFYGVQVGRETGVFYTWSKCEKAVKGYKNPKYRKFSTEKEALEYVEEGIPPEFDDDELVTPERARHSSEDPTIISSDTEDEPLEPTFRGVDTKVKSSGSVVQSDGNDYQDLAQAMQRLIAVFKVHKSVRVTPGALPQGVSKRKKVTRPNRR